MISRKVSAAPQSSDQPFQLTPVCRGGESPPHGGAYRREAMVVIDARLAKVFPHDDQPRF